MRNGDLHFCYCLLSWKQEFESKGWKLTSHDLCSPKSRRYFVLLLLFSGFCSCFAYLAWWIKSLSCIVEWYYVFHLGFHFVLITFWEPTRSTKCKWFSTTDLNLWKNISGQFFRSLTKMLSFCELDGALFSEICKMFLVLRYWFALHEKFMHSYSYAILLSIIIYKP